LWCDGNFAGDEIKNEDPFSSDSYYYRIPGIILCYIHFIKPSHLIMENVQSDEYIDCESVDQYRRLFSHTISKKYLKN